MLTFDDKYLDSQCWCGGAGAQSLPLCLFLCCGSDEETAAIIRPHLNLISIGEHIEMLFPFLAACIVGPFAILPSLPRRAWSVGVGLQYVSPSNGNLRLIRSLFVSLFEFLDLALMFCWILRMEPSQACQISNYTTLEPFV